MFDNLGIYCGLIFGKFLGMIARAPSYSALATSMHTWDFQAPRGGTMFVSNSYKDFSLQYCGVLVVYLWHDNERTIV